MGRRPIWKPPVISRREAIAILELKAETTGDARSAAAFLMAIDALRRMRSHGV